MSGPNGLDSLPVEVLELVIGLLDLECVCNLRLTNVNIASKASQGCFRTYFVHRSIRIYDKQQIAGFVQATQAGWMGTYLQHLTIIATVQLDAKIVKSLPPRDLELLEQAFSNLRRHTSQSSLASLTLAAEGDALVLVRPKPVTMAPSRLPDLRRVSTAAEPSWHAVSFALERSMLPIHKLNVFGGTPHCSLAIDRFAAMIRKNALSSSCANIQHLSLHLSHHVVKEQKAKEKHYPLVASRHNIRTVCEVLDLCPRLRCLNIVWRHAASSGTGKALKEETQFFSHIATSSKFPALRELGLRYVRVHDHVLLAFLEGTSLDSVAIEGLSLRSEVLRKVLDFLSKAQLKHLHLAGLWAERGAVSFERPGQEVHYNGPHHLDRCGEATSKPIYFHAARLKATARPAPTRKPCEWRQMMHGR